MQIHSTRRPLPNRNLAQQARPKAKPQRLSAVDFAPTAGGVVLGGVSALLGHQLAKDYGHEVVQSLIHKGAPLITSGTISLECAMKALPYLTDRVMQLRVGAATFGLAGFAVGAALLWPREG